MTSTYDQHITVTPKVRGGKARIVGRRISVADVAVFLLIAAQTGEHSGIVHVRKQTRSIGQIIALLELLHGVMTPAEMYGHVEYR